LACLILVVAVLLQPGKADAGALFSSSLSSTAFGPRGTQTLLAKITIGAAAGFMLLALALSLPRLTQSRSVVESVTDTSTPTPQATATPSQSPQAQASPQGAQTSPEQKEAPKEGEEKKDSGTGEQKQ
jgi:preprotein translocase subunit SecG